MVQPHQWLASTARFSTHRFLTTHSLNAAQPTDYVQGDGWPPCGNPTSRCQDSRVAWSGRVPERPLRYNFGGMTALACASKVQTVALLLARGADADRSYTPPQYEDALESRSILAACSPVW